MKNHLLEEPFYVFLMFAIGQALVIGTLCTGLFWLGDRLITAAWRRVKTRRAHTTQPTP